jgi:SAM-dependent methyltransferase
VVDPGIAPEGYYERDYSSRDWRAYRSVLAQALLRSEPGPMVDIGAGIGLLVEAAQRWGLDCEGIEGSAEAVEIARTRYPAIRLRQHHLSEGLPWPDATIQTAFLNQVIEHLGPDLARSVVSEVARVLVPGGMFYVASPSRFNKAERDADPTHVHLYTPDELERLLVDSGLERVERLDAALPLLGRSRVAMLAMTGALRLTGADRLSGTANCVAFKPAG